MIGRVCFCGRIIYHEGPLCFRCQSRPTPKPTDWFGVALDAAAAVCALAAIVGLLRAFYI